MKQTNIGALGILERSVKTWRVHAMQQGLKEEVPHQLPEKILNVTPYSQHFKTITRKEENMRG